MSGHATPLATAFAAATLALVAAPATAQIVTISGTGTVSSIASSNGAQPTGSVQLGDSFSFRLVFDPADAPVIFDGGPGFQVRGLAVRSITAHIGSYSFVPSLEIISRPVVLLGSGFRLVPPDPITRPFFAQTFIFAGRPEGATPFPTPANGGTTLSLISFFPRFLNGRTPGMSDIGSPADASDNRMTLVVGGPDGNAGVVEGSFTGTMTMAGVPEPATWAFMIIGFGVVGGATRRRRLPQKQAAALASA